MELLKEQQIQEWQGCYSEGWGDLLTPEAYAHPAKYSFSLIKMIFEYMLSQGYIQVGDTVLDPFGGQGGGAVATWYGLNYVAMELETKFCDMAAGCQCTGLSAEEYRRFFARFRPDAVHRLNYKDGRHFCPACLAALGKVEESPAFPLSYQSKKRRARIADLQKRIGKRLGRAVILVDPLPFPEKYRPTSSTYALFDGPAESGPIYRRNSGRIPVVSPHTYEGNLSRFKKYAQPGTTARLIQGDSRRLRARLAEVMDSVVSSPPFENSLAGEPRNDNSVLGQMQRGENRTNGGKFGKSLGVVYSSDPNNLGSMSGGFDAALSSPPFAGNTGGRGEASRNGIDAALFDRHSGGMKRGTGENPDNLDHLPMKGFGDALVSSPPYINSVNQSDQANDSEARIERMKAAGIDTTNRANVGGGNGVARQPQAYGKSDGQLGAMKEGELGGLVSSPPYADQPTKTNPVREDSWKDGKARPVGASQRSSNGYGDNPENLGNLPVGAPPAALVSSPPFIDSVGSDLPEKRGGLLKSDPKRAGSDTATLGVQADRNLTGSYGVSEGQLGAMNGNGFDGIAASPPYEGSDQDYARGWKSIDPVNRSITRRGKQVEASYGKTEGQLGIEQGQTFWAAAKIIVSESYLALKPGAYSAWVLKAFIRDGQRVEFPDQWRQLCEVCGFEFVEEIRAMLVKDNGTQAGLNGEDKRLLKEKKSFFRRLHESRLTEDQAHLRIDWETVIIMRKPL